MQKIDQIKLCCVLNIQTDVINQKGAKTSIMEAVYRQLLLRGTNPHQRGWCKLMMMLCFEGEGI